MTLGYPNVVELFEDQVRAVPDQPAIIAAQKELSYLDLNKFVDKLRDILLGQGQQRGERCLVYCHSPVTAIISMLGIFKSGNVFVPINTRLPKAKIAAIIQQNQPRWLICDQEAYADWQEIQQLVPGLDLNILQYDHHHQVIGLDDNAVDAEVGKNVEFQPDTPCYIYYTSGSTGEQKGVLGAYRGINHYINWELNYLGVNEPLRVSQFSPYSFDVFLRDVFVPLCHGGTICMPPYKDGLLEINQVLNWLRESKVNLVHIVPTLFREIIRIAGQDSQLPDLQFVLLAGEKLFWEDIKSWQDIFGDTTQLFNVYGPTETALAKFCYRVTNTDGQKGGVPLGQPIEGAKAILLDEELNPCAPGTVGEIFIKTSYRSLGYFRNESLTNSKFITHPMLKSSDPVLYRTGDLALVNPNGDFEFVGRTDFQVKLRGVRIELGTIEQEFLKFPGITNVAVVFAEEKQALGAYFLANKQIDVNELRTFLIQELPLYMIPTLIKENTALPRNLNGKIDRLRLLQQLRQDIAQRQLNFTAPQGETEKRLAAIWAEVLQIETDDIGTEDNFFDLGGHSMALVELKNRIEEEFEKSIELLDFFHYPNIRSLAEHWAWNSSQDARSSQTEEPDFDEMSQELEDGLNLFNTDDYEH